MKLKALLILMLLISIVLVNVSSSELIINRLIKHKICNNIVFTEPSGQKLYSSNGGFTWTKFSFDSIKKYHMIKLTTCSKEILLSTNGGYEWSNYSLINKEYHSFPDFRVNLYPNQVNISQTITIEFIGGRNYSIELIDTYGNTFYRKSNLNDSSVYLKLDNISSGIYYFIFSDGFNNKLIPLFID